VRLHEHDGARSVARQFVRSRTPLGRWATPEDVAQAMVFLASPAAAFITGQVLMVDGGMSVQA